jgi:hypothetical protein
MLTVTLLFGLLLVDLVSVDLKNQLRSRLRLLLKKLLRKLQNTALTLLTLKLRVLALVVKTLSALFSLPVSESLL